MVVAVVVETTKAVLAKLFLEKLIKFAGRKVGRTKKAKTKTTIPESPM